LVVAVVHGVLGLLTVALVLGLGRMWGLGRAGVVAALLVACDPILANQTAEVMTETLATFLAVVCLVAATRWNPGSSWKRAFCVGLLFGLASLCRPTFFIWTGMCAGYVVVRKPRGESLVRSAALVTGCLVAMMPWAVRNYCVMCRVVLATTHGGYTVLLGNNPDFYMHLRTQPRGQVWDARELRARLIAEGAHDGHDGAGGHPEFAADQRCYRMARAAIREQPGMFAYASLVRMGSLWSPLPHRVDARESWRDTLLRRAVAVWYIVVFSLALVGLWRIGARLWTPPWVWGVLLTVAFTLVHAVYWSDLRMRAPLMPVVCVAAAAVFAVRRDDRPADSGCK
jgi:4-amino-4-deoxy-L-arabinose transferase-like glycosyltransferase